MLSREFAVDDDGFKTGGNNVMMLHSPRDSVAIKPEEEEEGEQDDERKKGRDRMLSNTLSAVKVEHEML